MGVGPDGAAMSKRAALEFNAENAREACIMFKQIVIGGDEHEGGRDAIVLAKNLAGPDRVLTLAFVYCGERYVHRA